MTMNNPTPEDILNVLMILEHMLHCAPLDKHEHRALSYARDLVKHVKVEQDTDATLEEYLNEQDN